MKIQVRRAATSTSNHFEFGLVLKSIDSNSLSNLLTKYIFVGR